MLIIIIAIIAITVVIGNILVRDKLSRGVINIYLIWWLLWLILSTLNPYGLNKVSNNVYLLVLINIVIFTLGYCICGSFNKGCKNIKVIDYEITKHSIINKIITVVTIVICYYWFKFQKVKLFSNNSRLERFQVGGVFSSAKELLFFNYFIEAFTIVIIVLIAYMIVFQKFKNKVFIMLLLSMFFYSGIGSGRGPIIDVLIAMGLIYLIRKYSYGIKDNSLKKGNTENKKIKMGTIVFLIIVTLIIYLYSAWITAQRLGIYEFNLKAIIEGSNEFFKQGIVYYTGPFRALEYGIQNYTNEVGYLFGRGTLAGLDEIINMALSFIGINYDSANGIIARLLQDNIINIGNGQGFNNAYTSIMIHYFDFRVIGVIIFPFIYGIIVRKSIKMYIDTPVLPTLIIMTFLFITIINSVFKWGLQSPASNILLIICYLWYKFKYKKKIKLKITKY